MVVLSNFPPPTEGIRHQQPATVAHVNNRDIGKGTLFITESRLSWVNNSTGQGFSLEYPHIALHAVSRDLQSHPQECLYIMLDTHVDAEENQPEENADDDSSNPEMTEMRFIPDDKGMLDAMYHAMCECQALHPDQSENYDDSSFTAANGQQQLQQDEPMETEAGQFEDADCEPDN
ncbi:methylosome subunit pICln isoform X2 [Schistocerca americana]|uniref:methylosome subunit pICln isoform X2 n=1 Tax=Schistocerca americana TaxID=7009 RepID=UPI001F502EDB|nr:methylosome subunit pICln isoform X2 [Schistocerca americana]